MTTSSQDRNFVIFGVVLAFSQLVFMNIAWNHSYLGEIMIAVEKYYTFSELPIFQYRALPSFVYCAISFGCHAMEFALNRPAQSTYSIFQIVWDFTALNFAFFAIRDLFFSESQKLSENKKTFFSTLIVAWIFVFSFIFVPNRAFFYPYDFSDFAFLLLLAALSRKSGLRFDILSCLIIFIGAFNKETVLIFPLVFFILRFEKFGFGPALKIACILGIFGAAGKLAAIGFVDVMMSNTGEIEYAANQLPENISQLRNPLFYFSILSISAFLYLGLIVIANKFDRTDWCLLAVSLIVFFILFRTGISRELRIYIPMTTIFILIFSRHRMDLFDLLSVPMRDTVPTRDNSKVQS